MVPRFSTEKGSKLPFPTLDNSTFPKTTGLYLQVVSDKEPQASSVGRGGIGDKSVAQAELSKPWS